MAFEALQSTGSYRFDFGSSARRRRVAAVSLLRSERGFVTDRSGRIARQPNAAGNPQPVAPVGLAELNGWPMDSILAHLNGLAEPSLLTMINEAKTVKGLNAPRL
jgi:hypothetical protein